MLHTYGYQIKVSRICVPAIKAEGTASISLLFMKFCVPKYIRLSLEWFFKTSFSFTNTLFYRKDFSKEMEERESGVYLLK